MGTPRRSGWLVPLILVLLALVAPSVASAAPRHGHATAHLLVTGLQGGSGSTIGPDRALYVTDPAAGRITRRWGNGHTSLAGVRPPAADSARARAARVKTANRPSPCDRDLLERSPSMVEQPDRGPGRRRSLVLAIVTSARHPLRRVLGGYPKALDVYQRTGWRCRLGDGSASGRGASQRCHDVSPTERSCSPHGCWGELR